MKKKKSQILCNHGGPLLKYCEKSVKTYAGNLGHLTMSHRFFLLLKVVIDAIKISMAFLFFAFFLH